MEHAETVATTFQEVRSLLAAISAAHPTAAPKVAAIEERLAVIEQRLMRQFSAGKPRRGVHTTYAIEIETSVPTLAEHRPGSQPLRADLDLYSAVVEALSKADKALAFDDLVEAAAAILQNRPAEWQVRVVIRFLLRANPVLVKRSRSRYIPVDRQRLPQAAKDWWKVVEALGHT